MVGAAGHHGGCLQGAKAPPAPVLIPHCPRRSSSYVQEETPGRGPRLGLPSEGLWVKQGVAEERQWDGRQSRKGQQYTSLLPGLPLAGCVTHGGKGNRE